MSTWHRTINLYFPTVTHLLLHSKAYRIIYIFTIPAVWMKYITEPVCRVIPDLNKKVSTIMETFLYRVKLVANSGIRRHKLVHCPCFIDYHGIRTVSLSSWSFSSNQTGLTKVYHIRVQFTTLTFGFSRFSFTKRNGGISRNYLSCISEYVRIFL